MNQTYIKRLNQCFSEADDLTKISQKLADQGEQTDTRRTFLKKGIASTIAGNINPTTLTPKLPNLTHQHLKNTLIQDPHIWISALLNIDNPTSRSPHTANISPQQLLKHLNITTLKSKMTLDDQDTKGINIDDNTDENQILAYVNHHLNEKDIKEICDAAQQKYPDKFEEAKQGLLNDINPLLLKAEDPPLRLAKACGISGDQIIDKLISTIRIRTDIDPKDLYEGWDPTEAYSKSIQNIDTYQKIIDKTINKLNKLGLNINTRKIKEFTHNLNKAKNRLNNQLDDYKTRRQTETDRTHRKKEKEQDYLDLIRWEGEGGALAKENKFRKRLNQLLENI